MPLTFRLLFHGVRSVWVAGALALIVWLTMVPASQAERAALGRSIIPPSPFSLAQMRIARVFVHVAPERAAQLVSRASDGAVSPELAGMMLRDMAGDVTGQFPQVDTLQTVDTGRSVGGAKFVTVD